MSNAVLEAYKNLPALIRDAQIMPAWSPDGASFGFVSGPPQERQVWRVGLASGEKTALCDVEQLRAAIETASGETPPGRGAPFAQFGFTSPTSIAFAVGADQFSYDLESGAAVKAPPPNMMDEYFGLSVRARTTPRSFKRSGPLIDPQDAYEVMSPDGQWLLSIADRNVALRSTNDGRIRMLTRDGTPEVEWNFDWANPMLVMLGMGSPVVNWAPSGERLVAYTVDNRGVNQLPQPHYLKRGDECQFRYGTLAGGTLEKYTLYVLDVAGNAPVEIQLGDTRDTYPFPAAWLPNGRELLVFQMSRDCTKVDIYLADAQTGETRLLFTEQGETFVRIHHDIYYGRKLGLTLTPPAADGSQSILWLSERDGYKHLYRYDLDGNLLGQLTSGEWAVDAVTQVIGDQVYFSAHSDASRPYDLHLCKVPLAGGEMKQLTDGEGRHQVVIAPTANAFLDTRSTPSEPPGCALRNMDGEVLNAEVLAADISELEKVGYTPAEEFTVKAADGETDLWGVMYKPHDFDPSRKYPVVEYIYGGPQVAVADHGFASGASMASAAVKIAQMGCIVVTLDARGTPERSKAFHDVIHKDWSTALVADHAGAIRQLAERYSFIDADNVGITGGSWGGYSSTRCLIEAPDVYKAAVSTSPGYDAWASVLYECYLGVPQDNPEVFRAAYVPALADKLQGALMIACGTSDHFCWTDAMKMSEALIRAGKVHEFVVLPEQYHGYDSVHNDYMDVKMAQFFGEHLGLGRGE